jgi:hypothetical protein
MKPHLKVGSYFIYCFNSSEALGSTPPDAGGCQAETHRSVSFKIIKDILCKREINLASLKS